MKLAEFFAEIFFKTNPLPLKDLIKNIGELNARTILAGAGLDGIYVKLKQINEQSLATALSLNLFGAATNLPIVQAQKFANAVEQIGGNTQEALSDLNSLQLRLLKLKMTGQPDAGIAQSLYWLNQIGKAGINIYDTNVLNFLDRARQGFQRLTKEQQVLVLSTLGLSQSASLYLRMTDAQWESQKKNMAASDEQIRRITEMGGAWKSLSQVFAQYGMDITDKMAPSLTFLSKTLADLLGEMERVGIIKSFGDSMLFLSESARKVSVFMTRIIDAMAQINKSVPALSFNAGAPAAVGAGVVQNNTITLTVQGSESGAAGIGATIAKELDRALKNAFYQGGGKNL